MSGGRINRVIFISAGEASGDAHGAGVVAELRERFPEAELFGIGGDRMQAAGLELLEHSRRMSFMGFAEVVRHLPFIWRVRRRVLGEIAKRKPDLVILIDYPGFHFSLLRKLARLPGVQKPKVLYYIAPQVWAWKAGRARELARLADHIAVIFPFEVPIFERLGGKVTFVGHPLLDEAGEPPPRGQFLKGLDLEPDDRVVGLFPGSRKQEIRRHLPLLIETVKLLRHFQPELRFILAESPGVPPRLYERLLRDCSGITRAFAVSHAILAHANASLVKSGSTTIEAAYFGNPFVVFYKTSPATYSIGKQLVKVPFIAMPNLLVGEEAVRELIQHEATPDNLVGAIVPLLNVPSEVEACRARLKKVREAMGEPGAAKRVAEIAAKLIEE
ncbi:lipid-A-disaccharide synthase [bacterium]|nr:lipid-A-disaccharide synthase [bacterium]MBU1984889.1 lipid-A-disaccharide synthase [bacterium]